MKPVRGILCILMVAAMFLASTAFAWAIGFEAEEAYESVFVIYSGKSLGSGFAIGVNCVVTNAHVIDREDQITILSYGGEEYSARVLGLSESEDIAVLVVADGSFPYLPVGNAQDMKTGDDIYAIGAPKGMAYTLTKGSISAKERQFGDRSYIQIDAPINEGNSGGPLLSDEGLVLGMNTMKMSDSEGLGLAIPMEWICQYVSSLGIDLTETGNVADRLELPPEPTETAPDREPEGERQEAPEDPEDRKEDTRKGVDLLLAVTAAVSVCLNILLLILLVWEKKKVKALQYDPSERTDFEIDLWE